MIGSASDFTYKWCMNMGLNSKESARMALAVDEVLTDIILHAYKKKEGYMQLWYHYLISEIEIVIQEKGEPFDPDKHKYSEQDALENGIFEGAGQKIIRNITDQFLFLNRGADGKEFRIVKQLSSHHISDIIRKGEFQEAGSDESDRNYLITPATTEDAEDIAQLIYRTYDYSYYKDDLYYPKRVELALRNEYKFGVIVRTGSGRPAGYFAVIKNTDSIIGEVGEAVVSPQHRMRGLMKKMMTRLIDISRDKGLQGLYGSAVAVHKISQKVNQKFGFKSTAIILGDLPAQVFRHMEEDFRSPLSEVLEFLPLTDKWEGPVYLPLRYEEMLKEIYAQFERHPVLLQVNNEVVNRMADTDLHLKINYDSDTAVIIAKEIGSKFESSILRVLKSIDYLNLNVVYIDIPMNNPEAERCVNWLSDNDFLFAGLMPMFHKEIDHLRMQKVNCSLDFSNIRVLSDVAIRLKNFIKDEYYAIQEK